MKRLLFETHRWVGIVLAVFMLMWFSSGLVIVFTDTLPQTRAEQLSHLDPLKPQAGWLGLGEAWKTSAAERKAITTRSAQKSDAPRSGGNSGTRSGKPGKKPEAIVEARLVSIGGSPRWLVEDTRNRRFAISALDGRLIQVSPHQALDLANTWWKRDGRNAAPLQYLDTVEHVSSLRNYRQHQPFHQIGADDGQGTELLVSSKTGEVLQVSTRLQRGLYLAGNWLHLFRPLDAIGLGEYREEALKWAGFFAFAATLTGLIIGWLRWRPGWFGHATYSQGRRQPYREFWFKWHFWSGLVGGTVALLWAFSGYIDNNPFNLFSEGNIAREETNTYLGDTVPPVMLAWKPGSAPQDPGLVELTWRRLGSQAVLLAHHTNGGRHPVAAEWVDPTLRQGEVVAAVHRLMGDIPIQRQVLQTEYDDYYYVRHHRDPATKPLPVIRIELADQLSTHLYINPEDGRLLQRRDDRSRLYRWLYSGLHHWDFGVLYQRPLWDGWMVTWILFGLVLSVSAVVVGWKRLVLTFAPAKRKAPKKREIVPQLASENHSA